MEARLSHRQALNDNRRRVFEADRPIAFVCECGDGDCARTVVLTRGEYDAYRREDRALLAHEIAPADSATG